MFQAVKVDPKEGIAAAIARKKEQVSCSRAFFATESILNKGQERLIKEKEDKKQAGRGGAAKFR